VESRGKMRYAHIVWLQNMKGRDHLGDSETGGCITLQRILKGVWIDPYNLSVSCEHYIEILIPYKVGYYKLV